MHRAHGNHFARTALRGLPMTTSSRRPAFAREMVARGRARRAASLQPGPVLVPFIPDRQEPDRPVTSITAPLGDPNQPLVNGASTDSSRSASDLSKIQDELCLHCPILSHFVPPFSGSKGTTNPLSSLQLNAVSRSTKGCGTHEPRKAWVPRARSARRGSIHRLVALDI
jgi:hypothetical protein